MAHSIDEDLENNNSNDNNNNDNENQINNEKKNNDISKIDGWLTYLIVKCHVMRKFRGLLIIKEGGLGGMILLEDNITELLLLLLEHLSVLELVKLLDLLLRGGKDRQKNIWKKWR
ncbi:hypothetical protein RhiirB3_387089 [Rhizophagus irregularis]|nr:hypothetical protein RhiirB3_387089 [Rhizophagus irregularis]